MIALPYSINRTGEMEHVNGQTSPTMCRLMHMRVQRNGFTEIDNCPLMPTTWGVIASARRIVTFALRKQNAVQHSPFARYSASGRAPQDLHARLQAQNAHVSVRNDKFRLAAISGMTRKASSASSRRSMPP